MNRRQFLTQVRNSKATADSSVQTRMLGTGLAPYNGAWTALEVKHLLKRTMFGAKESDINHFLQIGVDSSIDELLNSTPAVQPPLRDYGLLTIETGTFDDLGVVQGSTWINDFNTLSHQDILPTINNRRIDSLLKWWVGLMVNQNRSIHEKMVLFWHHHFSVQREEVNNATMLYKHHQLLRSNALGNVRELTKLVSIDPAMLVHLNGYLNSRLAPDENFARELQELFTVGKGPDSAYTENDVIEAARVLTGWRINSLTYESYLDANSHDNGSKLFSSFYGSASIAGSANGPQEVNALIDMIFQTAESARFICRKLYKWFVYYEIDEQTESNVIQPLADILRSNNFEVRPVLETLLKSEHFYDKMNTACYIKSPVDFVIGGLRELDIAIPAYTDYVNGYPTFMGLNRLLSEMQQDLFQPPDVSGWTAYHQEPMFYEIWINSNTLPKRADFTDDLIQENMIDVRAFAMRSADPSDPDILINYIQSSLLQYPLSANSRAYLKSRFLLNDTSDNTVWTNEWNGNSAAVVSKLKELFKCMLNLPEYHLC